METTVIKQLMRELGGGFARALGIELALAQERELFKWFLASFLYGARISESIATKTYKVFEAQNVLTSESIQDTGWDDLVQILDEGGYARYDFSSATKLLEINKDLLARYKGGLNNVHAAAHDARDLEKRLQNIGKGIGPVTANIFLRELRGIWPKADPLPYDPVIMAARHLNLLTSDIKDRERMLELLKKRWEDDRDRSFIDFEAALVRLGLRYCRREKHSACPMANWCPTAQPK